MSSDHQAWRTSTLTLTEIRAAIAALQKMRDDYVRSLIRDPKRDGGYDIVRERYIRDLLQSINRDLDALEHLGAYVKND